jgi:hypothetical protein
MTLKLTTEQIIKDVENGEYPDDDAWEDALTDYIDGVEEPADAQGAARFLEHWRPGRRWTAAEFSGLMTNHFTGRWPSAAEIGAIRAHEDHEDGDITDERLAEILASDKSAAAYVTEKPGSHCFTDVDGTVLTFNGLSAGIEEST